MLLVTRVLFAVCRGLYYTLICTLMLHVGNIYLDFLVFMVAMFQLM